MLEEIILITSIPVIDSVRLFFRIVKGINPFNGDRNHIHHILNRKFGNTNTIIILNLLVFFTNYSNAILSKLCCIILDS